MHKWLLLLLLVVVGCADDGRTLRDPEAWQTTTTRALPPTSAPVSETSESGLILSSSDFEPGGIAPIDTTCAGANVFPNLEWDNLPNGATELVVTLTNQTDPEEPLLLWLLAGINAAEDGLVSGIAPAGAFETLNDYGNLGYGSPCLESLATGRIDLQFRLYILDQPSGLAGSDPGNEAWDSVKAQASDSASVLMRIEGGTAT